MDGRRSSDARRGKENHGRRGTNSHSATGRRQTHPGLRSGHLHANGKPDGTDGVHGCARAEIPVSQLVRCRKLGTNEELEVSGVCLPIHDCQSRLGNRRRLSQVDKPWTKSSIGVLLPPLSGTRSPSASTSKGFLIVEHTLTSKIRVIFSFNSVCCFSPDVPSQRLTPNSDWVYGVQVPSLLLPAYFEGWIFLLAC